MLSPSAFRKAMRTNRPPTAPSFDIAKFRTLIVGLDEDDTYLVLTAIYLCDQAIQWRQYQAENPLPELGARTACLLAAATLNREFHVSDARLMKRMRRAQKKGGVSMEHLTHVSIGDAGENFNVDAASVMDAATDIANLWLREAIKSTAKDGIAGSPAEIARKHMFRHSIRDGHNNLWTRAVWEAWAIDLIQGDQRILRPNDPDFARLMDAWVARHEANSMELANIDARTWPEWPKAKRREAQLALTVTEISRRPGAARRIVVGRPKDTPKFAPGYVVRKAIFEGSYISMFADRPLPKLHGMTIMELLKAWCVLDDLAERLPTSKDEPRLESMAAVDRAALCVTRTELIDVLKRALGHDTATAENVLRFLSWGPETYKGLWGAPLIPIPGEDRFALARNVLGTGNFVRLAEIWFTRGGLDDSLSEGARGDVYEALLRREIAEELAENTIIKDWSQASHGVAKKDKHFPYQIDLLVQFGSVVIVGEIKCFLFPTESIERFNLLKNVAGAARQAREKAAALDARRDVLVSALGITGEKATGLRIVPLVVLNQSFGTSLELEGCLVTDAKFLKLYLGTGQYVSAGFFEESTPTVVSRTTFYQSEAEAGLNLENFLRAPPPLRDFQERLAWTSFDFPTMEGSPLKVACTQMGDLTEAKRKEYERMKAR
jgi:hypothetical protein